VHKAAKLELLRGKLSFGDFIFSQKKMLNQNTLATDGISKIKF
jgi:hypothetical protein